MQIFGLVSLMVSVLLGVWLWMAYFGSSTLSPGSDSEVDYAGALDVAESLRDSVASSSGMRIPTAPTPR